MAAGDTLNVQSAGSRPAGYVDPSAIQVMKEIGIDISGNRSKHMDEFLQQPVETVITVCGNADQACPIFPGQVNRYHWGFYDPAHATGTDEEKLAVFRRVRDEIKMVFEAYAAGRRDQRKQLHRDLALIMSTPAAAPKRLAFFDRYLTVWVLVCMVVGVAFGKLLPGRDLRR